MFFKNLAESGEVESLVVLQQHQTEVELGEGQLEVMKLPHGGNHGSFVLLFLTSEEAKQTESIVLQSNTIGSSHLNQ